MTDPISVRVRMYNVGFGDCFLLSLFYPSDVPDGPRPARAERHVLFDFGSTRGPRNRQTMKTVAEQLALDCGGSLDGFVLSHRHKDHLSAFGVKATRGIIAGLEPKLIVRTWTEDPDLPRDAGQPMPRDLEDRPEDAMLLGSLIDGQDLAARVRDRAKAAGRGGRTDLVELAEDEVANADAVAELDRLAAATDREYLTSTPADGTPMSRSKLEDHLPGVRIRVLGPPRPAAWPAVARQAAESAEYWLGAADRVARLFSEPQRDAPVALGTARWIYDQLQSDEQRQVAALVRWLDDALNNTSVILLIEIGEHRLLFGGDAQIENWSWALDRARTDADLATSLGNVDLYKVGHHGSRNGTPKSLVAMWQGRPAGTPLLSMMSTKEGVHGHGDRAVPRPTLVHALSDLGDLVSTDEDAAWIDATADAPRGSWVLTTG